MAQIFRLINKLPFRDFLHPRWLIIVLGVATQLVVVGAVLVSMQQPPTPDIGLAAVAGNPALCQVVAVRPFSDAWVHGVQVGEQVEILDAGQVNQCQITTSTIRLRVMGLPGPAIRVDVLAAPVDFLRIAIDVILILIFNVTGAAIFLRAQSRPAALVTYALFFCTALSLCLFNLNNTNDLWINLLGFILGMVTRGLATTFVCVFPYSLDRDGKHRSIHILPYAPLLTGVILALLGFPIILASPPVALAFIVIGFTYNVVCVFVVIAIMIRGLRHLSRQERQLVRMIIGSIIFLLVPLALGLNLIRPERALEETLFLFIPIPLAALPVACNYALFRTQLLGTTSLLSRQAMRVLLWILLASIFAFFAILLLSSLSTLGMAQATLDYIYAGLLLVSLLLFPLVWSKIRNVGDQVFYGDFYEYNRSLRDLSTALTRLQGIEQISTFMLPRLAALLNATETSLLLRAVPPTVPNSGPRGETVAGWQLYRHFATPGKYAGGAPKERCSNERLISIVNLALTHLEQDASGPLLLDGMLLQALYDGSRCSGFLCLGPKFNLEPYSKQDASFLSTLAAQISVLEVNSRYLEQAQADAQQLAALTHRVISAQEEERRHLSLELHDEALQQAMLVVRQLSDAGTMAEVAEVMPLARAVVTSLRRTCLELRPPLLDELGLEEAFRWLAGQTEERSGQRLQIEVHCTGCWEERPPASVELALYRVGQEALSNTFKYAGASRAVIRLSKKPTGVISLLIADNGRGLQQKPRQAENLGLVGMHERMAAIGGKLQIRTSPGRGVTIRALWGQPEETGSMREKVDAYSTYQGVRS